MTTPYARDWGMKTALNDARAVIKEARGPKKKTEVWLGGHSLGASLTAAYAAWDFDGKPGFKDVEGLVLIDGGLLGSFDGFTLEEAQDAIEALETSNPFSDLLGIGIPESAGLFAEIGGSFARQDPTGSAAPLQDFAFLPAAFDPGFPVTNEALFGYAFDRDTSPESLRLLHANMGAVDPYAEGEISGWTDGGITPVSRMAKMFGDEPVNSVEWFFPKRLSIDTNGANALEQNDVADFLGLRLEHTDDIDVPIYAFQTDLTNGGVLEGAQNLVDRAKTKEKDAKLVEGAPGAEPPGPAHRLTRAERVPEDGREVPQGLKRRRRGRAARMSARWDCIVVGGGAAGLSAALVLGRARKRTLVIDAGQQCNLPADGIGGLLGHDGLPPRDLYAKGREELERYSDVELRDAEATSAKADSGAFTIELSDGTSEAGSRVLLTTGLDYEYPDIPGTEERWGRTVFHCPFCHGWEVRDQVLGVLDPNPSGATRAMLLRGWSDQVTLFTNGPAELDATDAERLREAEIPVDERQIAELRGEGVTLSAIAFAEGSEAPCKGLLVAPTLSQRSQLARDLGVRTTEDHPMIANAIEVDSTYCTSVENVFAAGDATGGMPSVANSVAGGSSAAAHIVHSLV